MKNSNILNSKGKILSKKSFKIIIIINKNKRNKKIMLNNNNNRMNKSNKKNRSKIMKINSNNSLRTIIARNNKFILRFNVMDAMQIQQLELDLSVLSALTLIFVKNARKKRNMIMYF